MQRIAVVGAGTMGGGIAQVLAEAEYKVVVADEAFTTYPNFLRIAKEKTLLGIFWRKNAGGKFVYRAREAALEVFNRIEWCELNSPEFKAALGASNAVIEAIDEKIDKKQALYAMLEKYLRPKTPIFTNTSVIRIGLLAEGLKCPERFMGLHFFNPVPAMKPVELIQHDGTNTATKKTALEISYALGKEPCVAPDRVGFISNGCFVPLIIAATAELKSGVDFKKIDKAFTAGAWIDFPQALRLVETLIRSAKNILAEGRTTATHIDNMVRLGFNMPHGPFEIEKLIAEGRAKEVKFPVGPFMLCDHVGLDVALNCCEMFKFQEPDKWKIPEILERMLAEGKRGKKNGVGFYEYKDEATFEMAPDKSCAKIGWTGKVLSLDIIKGIKEKFEFAKATGVKTVVLKIFHANGADITEFSLCLMDESAGKYAINTWHALISAIVNYPGAVIAAVEGRAFGGAYELALACDHIVAGKKATEHVLKNIERYALCPKRNCDPMEYSLADRAKTVIETLKTKLYWFREKKEKLPESFELARKAILEGNKKQLIFGLADEWKAITASFKTESAQRKIRSFLEGQKMFDPPKGTIVGLPEMTLGIMPGGSGTQTLPRRVGLALALRMILRGEIVKAEPPWVDEILSD